NRVICNRDEAEREVRLALHARVTKECAKAKDDVPGCAQQVRELDDPPQEFWSSDVEHYARIGFSLALPLALLVMLLPLQALYMLIAQKKRDAIALCERRIAEVEKELDAHLTEGKLDMVKGARDRLEALRADWKDCGSATWVMSRTSVLGILIAQVPTLIAVVTTSIMAWL